MGGETGIELPAKEELLVKVGPAKNESGFHQRIGTLSYFYEYVAFPAKIGDNPHWTDSCFWDVKLGTHVMGLGILWPLPSSTGDITTRRHIVERR